MQKVAFDHDISSSPDPSAIPPLRAVLSLQISPENVRSHELLLRYDIAFDRQISRALLRLQQLQERRTRRTEEQTAPNPGLPQSNETAKPMEKSAAATPAVPDRKDAAAKRTQQSAETKQPTPDLPGRESTSVPTPATPKSARRWTFHYGVYKRPRVNSVIH
jgi:hypothetical protein